MSKNKNFDFLGSIYMPVVVCTKKGRIVARNKYASIITSLPGNGLSIEAAALPEEVDAKGIRFRRLRADSETFRTALLFPIILPSGEEYAGWLFDVAFQIADAASLQSLLCEYREFTLPAGDENGGGIAVNATFCRFCENVYPALLETVAGHKVADVRYSCRSLLYSLRRILDKFGCRTELHLPDTFEPGIGVDYSSLVMSMIHLLIFVMSESQSGALSASVSQGNERVTVKLEVACANEHSSSGGIAELKALFPNCTAMIGIISASLAGCESDFSFECANGRLCVRFSQKTFAYEPPHALRQKSAQTTISALLVFAAMLFEHIKCGE